MSSGVLKKEEVPLTSKDQSETQNPISTMTQALKIQMTTPTEDTTRGVRNQPTDGSLAQQPTIRELNADRPSDTILIRSRSRDSPFKTFEGPGGTPRMTYGNPFDGSPGFQPNSAPKDKEGVNVAAAPQTREFSFATTPLGPSIGIKVSKAGPQNQTVIEEVKGFSSMHNSEIESDKKAPEPPKPVVHGPIVITSQPRSLAFDTLTPVLTRPPLPSTQTPSPALATTTTGATLISATATPRHILPQNRSPSPSPAPAQTAAVLAGQIPSRSSPRDSSMVRIVSQPQSPRPTGQLQPQVYFRQQSPGLLPQGSVVVQGPPGMMLHPNQPQVRVIQQQFQAHPPPGQVLVPRPIMISGQSGGAMPMNVMMHQHLQVNPQLQLPPPSQERPPTRVMRSTSQSPPGPQPAPTEPKVLVGIPSQQPVRRLSNLLEGLVPESRVKTLEAALKTRDTEISRLLGLLKTKNPQATISSESGNIKPARLSTDLQQQVQKLVAQMEAALNKGPSQQPDGPTVAPDSGDCVLSHQQVAACIALLQKVSEEQLRSIAAAEHIHQALVSQQEERKKWQELAEKLMVKVKEENKKRRELEKLLTLIPGAPAKAKIADLLKSFGDPWNDPPQPTSDKNPYADSMEDRTSSVKPRDQFGVKNPYKTSETSSPARQPGDEIQGLLGSLGRRLHTAFGGSNPYEDSEHPHPPQANPRERNPFAFGSMIGHAHNNREKKTETETDDTPLNPMRLTIAKNNLVYGSMVDDPNKQNEFSGNQESPDTKNIDPEVKNLLNRTSAIVLTETKSNQSPDQNRPEQRPSSPLGYYGAVSEYPVSRPGRKTQGDYQDSYYEDDGKVRKFSLTPPPPPDEEDSIVVPVNMSDGNPHTNDGEKVDPKADMIKPQKINSVDNSEKELHVLPIEDFRAMREELERLQRENDQLGEENSDLKKKIMQLQEELGDQRRPFGGGSSSDRPSPREKLSINVEAALQFAKIRETHEKSEIISYPAGQNLYPQKVPPTVTEVSKDDFGLSYSFRPKTGTSQVPMQSQFDNRDRTEEFHNNPSFGNPSAFMLPNSHEEVEAPPAKQTGVSFFGGDRGFQFAQADIYPAESKTDQSSAVSPKDREHGLATADTTTVGKTLLGQIGAVGHKSAGHLFKEQAPQATGKNTSDGSQSHGIKSAGLQGVSADIDQRRELSVELSYKTAELASLRDEINNTKQQLAQVSVDRDHLTVGNQRMQAELAKMARILKENNKDREKMAADIQEMKELMKGLVLAQAESRIMHSQGDPSHQARNPVRGPSQAKYGYHREPSSPHRDPERQELANMYRNELDQYRDHQEQVSYLQDQQTLRKLGLRERIAQLQKQATERHTVMSAYLSETEALGQEENPQMMGLRRNLLGSHASDQAGMVQNHELRNQRYADQREWDHHHSTQETPEDQVHYESGDDFREHQVDYHLDTEIYGEEEQAEMAGYNTPPRETQTPYQFDVFPDESS